MSLPACVVQVSDESGVFAAPLTAGNKVAAIAVGSGASTTPAMTVTDDSGTTYGTDVAQRNGTVGACVIASGNVVNNGTNSTSTVSFSGMNFSAEKVIAVEFSASTDAGLAGAVDASGTSASAMSNALSYDSDALGAFIVTAAFIGNPTVNFSNTGSTVDDQTVLINNNPPGGDVYICVCATDGSDDPTTAPTLTLTFGGSVTRPRMISAAYKLKGGEATGFTVTKRQTGVNKNQKGFADIAASPDEANFDVPTTITANSTAGTCNFIRSDGVQQAGSITLSDTQTAVMEVFSTQSASDIVFSWTTNNAAITSPAATSFMVHAIESAFVAVAPSMLWNASSPGSGFTSFPEASTVPHGTGVTAIAIAFSGDRAPFEYITDTSRTMCVPAWSVNPSLIQKQQFYFENDTPVDACNHKLHSDRAEVFGSGFEYPDVDGAYLWYRRTIPFNGLEDVRAGVIYYDAGGTLPKITSTSSNTAEFYAAFATDPVGLASINAIAANTTIVLGGTTSGSQDIPGSWTCLLPFVMKGADADTSIITSNTTNWSSVFTIPLHVSLIQIENVTWDATNIGQISASNAYALVFKNVKFRESLGEFSKYLAQVQQFSCFNGGVYFINCSGWIVSCEGVSGFQSSGDGLRNRIPDLVVGFDFFFNSGGGHVFSTYVKRFTNPGVEDGVPDSAIVTVTTVSSAFNVGTNSNLTRIIVTGMPTYRGSQYLAYTESVTVAGIVYPIVIGRTDVTNGILYAGGDLTGIFTNGVTLQLSACFMQRNHFTNTLTITGATNNHDGTATLTWADSGEIEQVGGYEQLRFATTSTTTALRGLAFYVSSVNAGTRTTTVLGELAGSAVAGDLIWMSQRAHSDSNQIGVGVPSTQDTGPIIEMNYLAEGFQSALLQDGPTFSVKALALINTIMAGYRAQIQNKVSNIIWQNTMWTAPIRQSSLTSAADFSFADSILGSTEATSPSSWNDGVLFSNSHGIEGTLPNGIGNTTGAITYDAFYNSTTSALQSRVWNTNVAFDLYGNAATTNGSTYSRIGAVLATSTPTVNTLTVDLETPVISGFPATVDYTLTLDTSGGTITLSGTGFSYTSPLIIGSGTTGTFNFTSTVSGSLSIDVTAINALGASLTVVGSPLTMTVNDPTISPGTLTFISQTINSASFNFGSASGYGSISVTFQASTSNGMTWSDEITLPNQDFTGVIYTTFGPAEGQTFLYREKFDNTFDTTYSNTITLTGLSPNAGSIMNSYAAMALSGMEQTLAGAAFRSMNFPSILGAGTYKAMIASGVGVGNANVLASVIGTVTAGTPLDIDLTDIPAAGTMEPIVLTGVKGILIQETSAPIGSNYLLVGDSSGTLTNAWRAPWTVATGQDRVGSGGAKVRYNPLGYTVDSFHKILRLNADSGTVLFQLDIIGTA